MITAFRICHGGSTWIVSSRVSRWLRCTPTSTSGPTPRTWVGVPISEGRLLPAGGLQWTPPSRSMLGSCWRWSAASFTFSLSSSAPRSPSSPTTSPKEDLPGRSRLWWWGGSAFLNEIAQHILRWAESHRVVLAPQFIMGRHNVHANALSRPNQVQGSEWTLKRSSMNWHRWPVMVDLFATSASRHCFLYFSLFRDPQALGTDVLLHSWDRLQVYAFPPWALIPQVLHKLRLSSGVLMTQIAPYWPQRPWFPDLLDLAVDRSIAIPHCPDLLRQPHFHCCHLGVSRLSLHAWRLSSDLPGLHASLPL